MNAVIYARFSSDNQREESITAQVRACTDYAINKGYAITDTYVDEALSARSDDRPNFQKMIADGKDKQFDVLICHKLDRFSRDMYDYSFYKRELSKAGITIEYVEQKLDGSPESVILESVLSGMAEYYSRNLARETLKGLKENAYDCKHCGGKPPLGYNVDSDLHYAINDAEAGAVKLIFNMKVNGSGYGEISSRLNELGYKSKRGKLFGKNALNQILRNKKYIGTYTYQDIVVENGMPAIIDKELFNRAQALMIDDRLKGKATAKREYYLSGKVFCGVCGSSMFANPTKRRKITSYYYVCRDKKYKKSDCTNPVMNVDALDLYIYNVIYNEMLTDEGIKKLHELLSKTVVDKFGNFNDDFEALKNKRDSLDKKLDNLIDLMAETGNKKFLEKYKETERQKDEIDKTLKNIKKQANNYKDILDHSSAILKEWQGKQKTPSIMKALFDTFVDKVIIGEKEIEVKFNISLLGVVVAPTRTGQRPTQIK